MSIAPTWFIISQQFWCEPSDPSTTPPTFHPHVFDNCQSVLLCWWSHIEGDWTYYFVFIETPPTTTHRKTRASRECTCVTCFSAQYACWCLSQFSIYILHLVHQMECVNKTQKNTEARLVIMLFCNCLVWKIKQCCYTTMLCYTIA